MDWQTNILPRNTRHALDVLAKEEWLQQTSWYLAGGTALALFEGHRQSVDLDFFTPDEKFSAQKLVQHFKYKSWITDIIREGTIYGTLGGAKVSFISYPFFIHKNPLHWYGAVRIIHPDDIAVMKIIAISQRGRKRDFIDLYWYCLKHKSLSEIVKCLPVQYPTVAHNYHHILKSLSYFDDAEHDVMPKIFFKITWNEIKKFFQKETKKATRVFLGLD